MRRAGFFVPLILAVLGTELPDIHTHDAGTPGYYSEECPLARLAVPAWSLPALARETLALPGSACGSPSPTVVVEPARPIRSPFAPRAPPATP